MSEFDGRRQANAEARAKREAAETLHMRKLLTSPEGMWLLGLIVEKGRIFETNFKGNSQDVFSLGRRDLALEFVKLIQHHGGPGRLAEIVMNQQIHFRGEEQ